MCIKKLILLYTEACDNVSTLSTDLKVTSTKGSKEIESMGANIILKLVWSTLGKILQSVLIFTVKTIVTFLLEGKIKGMQIILYIN